MRERALHAFPVDTLTHDEDWGSNGWSWAAAREPSVTIAYWSDGAGRVTLGLGDALLACPASVAVHDDRDVPGDVL